MNHQNREPSGIDKAKTAGPDTRHGPGPEMMGAGTLIGNDVYNREGKDLGKIKEIMLDMRSARISYAVLSFGSFLGMGEKLFAVPWDALSLDTDNKRFTLDLDTNRLKEAPGFDRKHWPNMADASWARQIHSYYQTRPYSEHTHGIDE
jgi:sporulation protein YlmC with PRC-barrel domain